MKSDKNQEKYTNYIAFAQTHVDAHTQGGTERGCSSWENQTNNTLILQQKNLQIFKFLKT